MTVSQLRDHFRAVERASAEAATSRPSKESTPQPPSRAEPALRQRGAELVKTASTHAYDISTNAYTIDADAYSIESDAYSLTSKKRRKHPLVAGIGRSELRQAFVWREILDAPVSLKNGPPGVEA